MSATSLSNMGGHSAACVVLIPRELLPSSRWCSAQPGHLRFAKMESAETIDVIMPTGFLCGKPLSWSW